MELSKEPLHNQGAFVSHANAQLTPRARLRLARLVLEQGWICTAAAKMFTVSPRTAAKWASRYRSDGPVGMVDRRRPHRSPTKTPPAIVMSGWRDLNSRPLDPQVGAARRTDRRKRELGRWLHGALRPCARAGCLGPRLGPRPASFGQPIAVDLSPGLEGGPPSAARRVTQSEAR